MLGFTFHQVVGILIEIGFFLQIFPYVHEHATAIFALFSLRQFAIDVLINEINRLFVSVNVANVV